MNLVPVPDRPIVCMPHAGAGAAVFECCKVRAGALWTTLVLPGREAHHGGPLLRSIAEMGDWVATELILRADATLFGHSMGAPAASLSFLRSPVSCQVHCMSPGSSCIRPESPLKNAMNVLGPKQRFLRNIHTQNFGRHVPLLRHLRTLRSKVGSPSAAPAHRLWRQSRTGPVVAIADGDTLTLGSAVDISLRELRIETFHPASADDLATLRLHFEIHATQATASARP